MPVKITKLKKPAKHVAIAPVHAELPEESRETQFFKQMAQQKNNRNATIDPKNFEKKKNTN